MKEIKLTIEKEILRNSCEELCMEISGARSEHFQSMVLFITAIYAGFLINNWNSIFPFNTVPNNRTQRFFFFSWQEYTLKQLLSFCRKHEQNYMFIFNFMFLKGSRNPNRSWFFTNKTYKTIMRIQCTFSHIWLILIAQLIIVFDISVA